MATNDFKPFAASGGANVVTQSAWETDTGLLANGFSSGIAESAKLNKVWRQNSIITSQIAEICALTSELDILDDGDLETVKTHLNAGFITIGKAVDFSPTVNVLTANLAVDSPLVEGMQIQLKPAITNTSSVTLNLNGTGNIAIQSSGNALSGGELLAGRWYVLVYNGVTNKWDLQGAASTAVTQATPDNSTKIATTAFVKNQNYAPLTSPTFSGVPTAPTASLGDNSTTLATTAFVTSAISNDTIHLLKSGGTMTGALTLNSSPTNTLHAATKGYVDGKKPTFERQVWTDAVDIAGGANTYYNVFATVKTHTFTVPAGASVVNIIYRTNCHHSGDGGKSAEFKLLLNGVQVAYTQSNVTGGDNVVHQLPMSLNATVTGGTTYTLTLQAKVYDKSGHIRTNYGQDAGADIPMGQSEIDIMYFY